jgi:nucleotide-binding universal stress UspA family protein
MRILLANSGLGSQMAAAWVAAWDWPAATTVRVVTVIEPSAVPLPSFQSFSEALTTAEAIRFEAESEQNEITSLIAARGLAVSGALVYGWAESKLVQQARDNRVDLLVVGAALGGPVSVPGSSVARDLLDVAPCSVVVVRRESLTRVVLATDGSPGSLRAEDYLVNSRALAALPILVVSVAETQHLVTARFLPALREFDAGEIDKRTTRHREIAGAALVRLVERGCRADAEVRKGEVAIELASAVDAFGGDLVILGSDGKRGLSRVVLGSVARDVADRTNASVLVVRPQATAPVVAHDPPVRGVNVPDAGGHRQRVASMLDGRTSAGSTPTI